MSVLAHSFREMSAHLGEEGNMAGAAPHWKKHVVEALHVLAHQEAERIPPKKKTRLIIIEGQLLLTHCHSPATLPTGLVDLQNAASEPNP